MNPFVTSPYVSFVESRLIPTRVQYGVFHQLTGETSEPTERVRTLLHRGHNRISDRLNR